MLLNMCIHVDCAIHNLEKQSVVDVEDDDDDDDDGNDDVVNAANDDDYGGNEEGTKNFGDNDEDQNMPSQRKLMCF